MLKWCLLKASQLLPKIFPKQPIIQIRKGAWFSFFNILSSFLSAGHEEYFLVLLLHICKEGQPGWLLVEKGGHPGNSCSFWDQEIIKSLKQQSGVWIGIQRCSCHGIFTSHPCLSRQILLFQWTAVSEVLSHHGKRNYKWCSCLVAHNVCTNSSVNVLFFTMWNQSLHQFLENN